MTALLGLALMGSASTPAIAGERRYALVIGANRGDASDVRLQFAERDAERVAQVLRDLGGIEPADLVILNGPQAGEVRAALGAIEDRIAAEAGDDQSLLFVYYSGHADASDLRLSGTRLPLEDLRDQVADNPADVRLLVVDACRSGELTRLKGAAPAEAFAFDVDDALESEGLAVITSAAAGEDAQESDRLQGGVFTHHFVAALQGAADISGDHLVTLSEAYRYTYAQTIVTTSRAPTVQHPSFSFDLRGRDDLVLTELEGARRVGFLELAQGGTYVVYDPRGADVIAEIEIPDGGRIALAEGRYRLRLRTPARVYQADVSIDEGQVASVGPDAMRQLPYGETARRGAATERAAALAVVSGGQLATPMIEGLDMAPGGFVGVRLERPELSLQARGGYGFSGAENLYVAMDQRQISADLSAFKLFDRGRLAAGAGVRLAGARVSQVYTTDGAAEDRRAWGAAAGLVPRGEIALLPRLSLGLEGGAATWLLPTQDDSVPFNSTQDTTSTTSHTVFHAGLDLSLFVY